MNWNRNRKVTERWFIEGALELVTPTSLSNGDDDPLVDLPVVVDPLDGRALLTGASLAGALRAYLADFSNEHANALFGGERRDREGEQSPLIVEDALGTSETLLIELRDGVSIDPATRTAKDKERYDRQLLAAGTKFALGFELIIAENPDAKEEDKAKRKAEIARMKAGLALALQGLQDGKIRLGGRKRRGYGECRVTGWRAWRYDLGTANGIRGWLAHDRPGISGQEPPWEPKAGESISHWDALKDVGGLPLENPLFELTANFAIDGAVLIRHGFEAESGPDVMHLTTRRDGKDNVPVISGTSLAGVIRGQALRIARTVAEPNRDRADAFIEEMFGIMEKPTEDMSLPKRRGLKKIAGRVRVDESKIEGQTDLVQTRVKIDRFTGGAFESALFAEQPAFGGGFTMKLAIRPLLPPKPPANPEELTPEKQAEYADKMKAHKARQDAEAGLMLLVLKDLWTGFLPVGGSSSVGRGRLKGRWATIQSDNDVWKLEANGDSLAVTSKNGAKPKVLNDYVTAFTNAMKESS
ncbi:MAG: hypothetical protein KIS95_14605 [Anaerolineae bacterium]|nr:hypothetical protein [Anaerolineae bacterium]